MSAFVWKSIGAAVAAMGLGAVSYFSRPQNDHAQVVATSVASPATSSPAPTPATASDLNDLRKHFDERFDSWDTRLRVVEQGFADVHGYIEAQKQHELERAIAGKRR